MIDIVRTKQIKELKDQGYSYASIASMYGVSKQAIHQQLKKLRVGLVR